MLTILWSIQEDDKSNGQEYLILKPKGETVFGLVGSAIEFFNCLIVPRGLTVNDLRAILRTRRDSSKIQKWCL